MGPRRFAPPPTLPRRQLLLFVLAILLPCAVLLALGVRLVRQERELGEKRFTDQRRAAAAELRRELQATLEQIRAREMAALDASAGATPYVSPATALVARFHSERLVLPWEADPGRAAFVRARADQPFAGLIAEGERAELVNGDNRTAARAYRRAAAVARHPSAARLAEFLEARSLTPFNPAAARQRLARLIATPGEARDDEGVPIAAYAARRLFSLGALRADEAHVILALLRSNLTKSRVFSPTACMIVRDLATTMSQRAPSPEIAAAAQHEWRTLNTRCESLEQAAALTSSPRIAAVASERSRAGAPPSDGWWVFGKPAWLVSVAASPDGRPVLVGIRAEAMPALTAAPEQIATLTVVPRPDAERVGGAFDGVWMQWRSQPERSAWTLQQSFYVLTLIVVVGVGMLGAYLLWRDVRRELRLAELRSQFVASVTHELKTPLTSIRLFAETLRDRATAEEHMRREYLETIVAESERLTRLLNNVLELSRIESGAREYRLEPHDAGDLVRVAARTMRQPLAQQGFTLRLVINEQPMPVLCDADAVEQAVLNLLANALKYSADSHDIDLRAGRVDGAVAISVRDYGLGVPESDRQRIFEKFHRAATPENRSIPGAGLGLAIVQHVVAAHGGRVTVESELGRGSAFTIHLPLAEPVAGQAQFAARPMEVVAAVHT